MNPTNQTVSEVREAVLKAIQTPSDAIAKAWVQPGSAISGLNYYDLEGPAKLLYQIITPLRNRIPRVSGKGGIQANWRAITGINTANLSIGVAEGNRGGVITTSTVDYLAAYRGIGLEDSVTFEAQYAVEGFDDLRARAQQGLLRSVMIGEEKVILGGNTSVPIGTTGTPVLAASASGGTLATQTLSVICVALSFDAYLSGTVAGGINASVVRTNADATTTTYGGGAAQKSANATVAVTGATGSCTATVTALRGAVAYAWFWGAAASEVLGAITTINSVVITANAAGTQTAASLPSADNSTNSYLFDGILYQTMKSGSNGYFATLATGIAGTGTPLTAGSDGTIAEFDTALKSFWDNYRLSPTDIYVSSQEMQNIRKKVLTGSASAAQRFTFTVEQGTLRGGTSVKSYLNPFTMDGPAEIPIHIHPNMPPGTVLFYCDLIPYPLSNVTNLLQIRARQDYYSIEWPLKARKYEYSVYADEVLQNYFPPAFGVITNIANG